MIRLWILVIAHMGNGGDFLEVTSYSNKRLCDQAKAAVLEQMNQGGYGHLVKAACVPAEH